MKITYEMNLSDLAERMGSEATEAEARHMREALAGLGAWETTEDVPEHEWDKLLIAVAEQARNDE